MKIEAKWYSGRFRQRGEQADESREKANQLWIAAQEAKHLAREYGRQILHGRYYKHAKG